jgi:Protein of unknown function (DUF1566)
MSTRSCVIALIGLLACGSIAHAQSQSWDIKLPASTRFIVLDAFGGEAVLDKETGLVWERSPGGTNGDGVLNNNDKRTWLDALGQCVSRRLGNRRGWRLPTIQELATLTNPSVSFPNLTLPTGHPFNLTTLGAPPTFWSASTAASVSTFAWIIPFNSGNPLRLAKSGSVFIWCVRGGQGVDPQ